MISGRPPTGAAPPTGDRRAPTKADSRTPFDFDRTTISAPFSLQIQHRGLRGWNHSAAIGENEWILSENCGQPSDCEYPRHPHR